MLAQAELQGDVVEAGVLGIHAEVAVAEVGVLQTDAGIKQECDGVDGRIGCRISHVDEFVSQTVGYASHTAVGCGTLVGEQSETVSRIR